MYSVLSYGQMAADSVRIDAYARAIAKSVKPGDVVVDLGAGSGIMTLLSLRAGAERVHAIDTNPAVLLVPELVAENGFAGRVEVHNTSSFDVQLPQQADVVVADLRGSCPLFEQALPVIHDARTRLLAPGGVLIPTRDRLLVGCVEVESIHRDIEVGWKSFERQGFKASAARMAAVNARYSDVDHPISASQLVSEAKEWAVIDYGEPVPRSYASTVDLPIARGGTVHALAIWFEATVLDGIGFQNGPGHRMVYKIVVLPLAEPARVEAGDSARVTLRTDPAGDQWAWDTELGGRPRMRQSTFLGMQTSAAALFRESLGAKPERSAAGDRAARVLSMMNGEKTIAELAETINASEPSRRRESVLDEVKGCVRRYAR